MKLEIRGFQRCSSYSTMLCCCDEASIDNPRNFLVGNLFFFLYMKVSWKENSIKTKNLKWWNLNKTFNCDPWMGKIHQHPHEQKTRRQTRMFWGEPSLSFRAANTRGKRAVWYKEKRKCEYNSCGAQFLAWIIIRENYDLPRGVGNFSGVSKHKSSCK